MSNIQASNVFNLSGRVALVTGGGTGIGLMIAKAFAANGAKVYISGRRLDVLGKAARDFVDGTLIPLQLDATRKEDVLKAVQTLDVQEGRLDILVNNAGIMGSIVDTDAIPKNATAASLGNALFADSYGTWMDVMSLNVVAPFFVTTAFLGLLEKGASTRTAGSSAVINISSCISDMNNAIHAYAYVTSKAALDRHTKALALELGQRRLPIRVNLLAPGTFPSEITGDADALLEVMKAKPFPPGSTFVTPAQRPGREEEVGAAALFLATSEYTTGTTLMVDGGLALVNP